MKKNDNAKRKSNFIYFIMFNYEEEKRLSNFVLGTYRYQQIDQNTKKSDLMQNTFNVKKTKAC